MAKSKPQHEEIDLNEQEEAALDRAWDKIEQESEEQE